jgi:ATP-binding cassette subfamily C protein
LLAKPFLQLISREPALRRGLAACVLLALTASAAEIAAAVSLVPILVSLGVSAGSEQSSFVDQISPASWLILFVLAAGLQALAKSQLSISEGRSSQRLAVVLQGRLYRALAAAHWDTIRRISPSKITSALQTQTYEAVYGFSGIVQVATATLLVIGYLAAAAFLFPLVLPGLLLLLGVMWFLNARRSDRIRSLSEEYVAATTELHERYEDWVAISRVCSLGVDSAKLADRFDSSAHKAASNAIGYARSSAATQISYQIALIAGILIGVPIAWWLDTPPALLVFGLLAVLRILPRAGSIQVAYQGIVNAVAPFQAIDRLTNLLEADRVAPPNALPVLEWEQIELAEVGVSAQVSEGGERWILRKVDLRLKHGEWLAVTGPTGAGKTTLADAVLMLVRPDAGEIRINDEVADEEVASRWRNQAAYVPQEVVLFDASIRENLKLYVPDATDMQLENSLRQAAAEFVLELLPEGLDTRAGPGGRWLSGGERQRIGIARALLREPGLLVLDEPTSALDSDTQQRLMDALSSLDHKMSVVFITHRPELLRLADKIIGMEDGFITRRDDGFRRSGPDLRHP